MNFLSCISQTEKKQTRMHGSLVFLSRLLYNKTAESSGFPSVAFQNQRIWKSQTIIKNMLKQHTEN